MALLQHLQCGEQFVAKVVRPITDRHQRRERTDHIEATAVRAERGLDSPQRENDPAVDVVLPLDRIERWFPFARLSRHALNARLRSDAREIRRDWHAVFERSAER